MKRLLYWAILRPLILRDYRLRAQGKRPDRWHWADAQAVHWGFLPEPSDQEK